MDNSFKFNILWQNKNHNNQIYDSVLFKEFEIIFHGKKQQVLNTKVWLFFRSSSHAVSLKKTLRNRIVSKLSVSYQIVLRLSCHIQANLDMTDSMGPGKLVRHMQNLSYTYDTYLICMGLGPSISSVIAKSLSYSGPSYPSSPVLH